MSAPLGGGLVANVRAVLDISDFVRNASRMSAEAAKVAKAVGRVGGAIAPLAAAFNAGLGAAVHHAAEFSSAASFAVQRAKVVFDNLAISVSHLVLPAFKTLTEQISKFVAWIQSLNAHQRQNIASFLEHTAVVLAAVAAFGKVSSIAASLFRAFSVLAPVLASITAPMIGIAIAVAGVVLLFGYLYHTVRPYWDDLKAAIKETWDALVTFLQPALEYVEKALGWLKDKFFDTLEGIAKLLDSVGAKFGKDLGMSDMFKSMKESLSDGTALAGLKSLGERLGHAIVTGVKDSFTGLKEIYKDSGLEKVVDKIKGAFKTDYGVGNAVGPMKDERPFELRGTEEEIGPIKDLMNNAEELEKAKSNAMVKIWDDFSRRVKEMTDTMNSPDYGHKGFGNTMGLDATPLQDKVIKIKEEEAAKALQDWIDGFKDHVIGSLGRVGQTIKDAGQAFSQGGPWAALIAIIWDLIANSQAFQIIMKMLDTMFQEISDLFGQLIKGLEPVMGAIQDLLANIIKRIGPLFVMMGQQLQNLAPFIELVAVLFQIIAALFSALKGTLGIFGDSLKILWPVIKTVIQVIGYIVLAIGSVANSVIKDIQFLMNAIGDLPGLKKFKTWAKNLNDFLVDTDSMKASLDALNKMTWDSAMAQANATAQTLKFADSLGQATGVLNAPDGFKVTLEEWRNMRAVDPSTVAAPGQQIIGGTPSAPSSPAPVTVNVNGVTDPQAVANKVVQVLGNSLPGTGRLPYIKPHPRFQPDYLL